ncbi:T9SS type A sorting domain-containing protein, partial [Cytophagia bacterium CHB2]|nr:T9SS type A sorting domain-containing protein [Cytophagia bacterium CHB2]
LAYYFVAQWVQQTFLSTENLYKVRFVNNHVGWVLGGSGVFKTTDGGNSWTRQDSTLGYGDALFALNQDVAFYSSSGTFAQPSPPWLRRTIDGGISWQTADNSYFRYSDFAFVNDSTGYAVASNQDFSSGILKTVNRGKTWQTIATRFSEIKYELIAITFVDTARGWALSYDAFVYHTDDGGATWALQDSLRPRPFLLPTRDIVFTTPDSGWIVGGLAGNMLIARTVDGGNKWDATVQAGCSLREVSFMDSQTGWNAGAVLGPPFILRTQDSGNNWQTQTLQPATFSGIESLFMINEKLGWAVGGTPGRVYKFDHATSVETWPLALTAPPEAFYLAPNYPNPFNAGTRIAYSIPHEAPVKVAIYDLSGREVAVLEDAQRPAGFYEVAWEGRDHAGREVPSGVYIYKLRANFQNLSRKLLLLR